MYVFAIMVLSGLGVLVVSKVADRYLSLAPEAWAFLMIAIGVGAAWLVNLDLFAAYGIPVRNGVIGVTITGILVGGVAFFWREILEFFGGLSRKFTDEAATMEKSEHLRRVA